MCRSLKVRRMESSSCQQALPVCQHGHRSVTHLRTSQAALSIDAGDAAGGAAALAG